MFTPQQIQEQTFAKAIFGGYDMEQVDEFLEPLTDDYITLYKENSVLKSKMKVLVEKLEEYRAQEVSISKALSDAKAKSEQMIREAEARCAAMQPAAPTISPAVQAEIDDETTRLNYAKRTALSFIEAVEKDVRGHLELLEQLKSRDLAEERKPAAPAPHEKPYDWQSDPPLVVESLSSDSTEAIASEISENLEKLIGADAEPSQTPERPAPRPVHPESATIKFDDLKFGRNYDPKGGR